MPEFDHGVNVPLLRKTLEYVTEHPEEHDQGSWGHRVIRNGAACKTSHCLAGWAVVLDGEEAIDWDNPDDTDIWMDTVGMTTQKWVQKVGGRDIEEVARELLGLPHDSLNYGSRLFRGGNDLTQLWRLAAEYTGGEIEIPDEFR